MTSLYRLKETSARLNAMQRPGHDDEATASLGPLSIFVDVIGECDRRTASPLAFVDANAGNVQSALDLAIADLKPLVGDTDNRSHTTPIVEPCDLEFAPADANLVPNLREIHSSLFAAYIR